MSKSYFWATLLLCVQILFWCSPFVPTPTENFRMRFNAPVAREITEYLTHRDGFSVETLKKLTSVSFQDDLGMPLLWSFGAYLEGIIPDEYHASEDLPALWQVWCIAIFLLVQWISTIQLLQFFGPIWGPLPLGFFWFHPLIQRNILSFDVYLFPLYGALLSLSLLSFVWPEKFIQMKDTAPERELLKKVLICAIPLIGFFEWMRSGSLGLLMFLAPLLIVLIIKKKNISHSIVCVIFAALILGYLPSVIFKHSKHVFYHALCAGLFEEGGRKDPIRGWLPKALFTQMTSSGPEGQKVKQEETLGWSDHIQYQIAKDQNQQIVLYSNDYHQVMKNYVLLMIGQQPVAFIKFTLRRAWRMLYIWPYWPLSPAGQLEEKNAPLLAFIIPLFVLLVILCLLVAWWNKYGTITLPIFFLAVMVYLAAPGLLVHSTYTIYTIAFRVLLPLGCWTMLFLLARSSRGSVATIEDPR